MSDFLFEDFARELDSIEVRQPGAAYQKLPAGEHNVEVTKAQLKEYDEDVQIGLQGESVGGDFHGASTWVNLKIKFARSAMVEKIAKEQVKQIMVAAGIDGLKDVEDLVGATFGIKLEYYQDKYAQIKRVYKQVGNPTGKSEVAATADAPAPAESDNPFDRF